MARSPRAGGVFPKHFCRKMAILDAVIANDASASFWSPAPTSTAVKERYLVRWDMSRVFREVSCGHFPDPGPWKLQDEHLQISRKHFAASLAKISSELRSGTIHEAL